MLWLTGHWEWHALSSYVVAPLEGEPTLIYSMGGTHAEAVRRQVEVAVKDVRHSRNGRYADIMVERLRELKLERGRIGLMEIDPRHADYLPVNQYNVLRENLPDADIVFTQGFLHELLSIHSAEELDCIRKAGLLCQNAMEAMVARAKPGVKEYELRAAAGAAILEGGGDIDFLIIGSTPMANPAMIFGNPRPSGRVLQHGDIINMELAAGYRGYTAQIGSPSPPRWCANSGTRSRSLVIGVSSPRLRQASRPKRCVRPADFSATTAINRGRPRCTASISSPTNRMSSPNMFRRKSSKKCSSPAW
jgi:Xaa-Pro aminopeptidase